MLSAIHLAPKWLQRLAEPSSKDQMARCCWRGNLVDPYKKASPKQNDFIHIIHRISGLDPAGPLFFTVEPSYALHLTLNKTDAKFVDIIHTDRNAYGFPLSTATADFYPNGGARHQPGCVQFQLKTDEGE